MLLAEGLFTAAPIEADWAIMFPVREEQARLIQALDRREISLKEFVARTARLGPAR